MRIAYLSVSDQLGGSEIALLEMIKGVRRARPAWSIHLILPGRGPLLTHAEAAGADCTVLPLPKALSSVGESAAEDARWSIATRAALGMRLATVAISLPAYIVRLRHLLRTIDPDIVHSNGLKAHITAARAIGSGLRTTGAGPRLVWHIHDYISPRRVTRTLLRAHERSAAAIVANSASVADDLRSTLSPSARIEVVHNAVDLATFAPGGPAQDLDACAGLTPAPSHVVRVGLVATFARWKGHEVFLRAIAALPESCRVRGYVVGGAVYDTAGSQHSQAELTSLARELGIADRVAFTGFVAEPADAIRALDVVVHASTDHEAFGLVIAEAMACGRPVVTSGTGGAAELIRDGEDALTHRAGDAADLAARVAMLAGDEPLRRRLGGRAHETATRRFDSHRLAGQFATVYHDAARQRPGVAR